MAASAERRGSSSAPTFDVRDDIRTARRARTTRRVALFLLALVVGAGATGMLGVRTATVSVDAGAFDLLVTYARTTRPGLATPFGIEVRRPGGFDGPVTIAVSESFLAAFDENGLDPDPVSATSGDGWIYWTFDPPPGESLHIDFDARLEPSVHWRRNGAVKLMSGGSVLGEAQFTMWVMP